MVIATPTPLTEAQVNQYRERGYLIVEGVLTQQECQELMSRAAALHARGCIQGCFEAVPEAEAGGRVIHGSEPNYSKTRFRRSLICHYVTAETTMMADFYKPVVPLHST